MKKIIWYAITCETEMDEEEIVGFNQAMIYRTKAYALKQFKEFGYDAKFKIQNKQWNKYRIRRLRI